MTTVSCQTYYEILEISTTATDQEIKEAYKKKALCCHPDKAAQNHLTIDKATAAFKLLHEAYETLSNSRRRMLYDMNISTNNSVHVDSSFFSEKYDSYYSQRKSKDDYKKAFYPDRLTQEMNNIIDCDSIDLLEKFLKSNRDEDSLKSFLYYGCKKGKFTIVKHLIESRKLSPNLTIDDGLSFTGPIFKAAAESGNLILVKYFLEVHHVDIESQGLTDGTKDTALSRAALQGHEPVVEYLISKGAQLNPKVSYSDILSCAITSKKLSVVRLLVEAGTKIGDYTLGKALEVGVLDIVQYFLHKRPGIKAHQYISSPACIAISSGNVTLVKYLEEKENLDIFEKHHSWDDSIDLLIEAAAKSGSIEMMRFLLDERGLNEKISTNIQYVQSALSIAVKNKKICPSKNEAYETLKFVQFLIEEIRFVLPKEKLEKLIINNAEFAGIEMNSYLQSYLYNSGQEKEILLTIANHGLEAFSLANLFKLYNAKMIKKGKYQDFSFEVHRHIKERMISLGQLRELFLENQQSMTEALFYYSSYYFDDDLSPLKLLLELGVDLNAENSEGIAAIHVALQSGGYNNIVEFYITNKADLSKKNKHGESVAQILETRRKHFKFWS